MLLLSGWLSTMYKGRIMICILSSAIDFLNLSIWFSFFTQCNKSTDRECSDGAFVTHLYSNPDALWDMFPCPPPWKPELILELPWKDRLGEEDGDRFRQRLASRCGLDLVKLQAVALQDSLIFRDCDIYCFIGILIGILTVCVSIAMVTVIIRR